MEKITSCSDTSCAYWPECVCDALRSQLEKEREAAKRLVESSKSIQKYHAFIPDALAFLEFDAAISAYEAARKE